MSAECCEVDDDAQAPVRRPIVLRSKADAAAISDSCCTVDDNGMRTCALGTAVTHDDDHDQHNHGPGDEEHDHGSEGEAPVWWRDRHILVPLTAGFFLAVGYILQWSGLGIASTAALTASLLAGASTFVPGAVRRLLRGTLGVGLLMTIAAAGAVLLGHVGEAAALAFLFSIAEALEDRAIDKAKDGLRSLLNLIPQTALVSRIHGTGTVPIDQLKVLDILVVRPGDRVATDGVVVSGRSSMDTSAVTGESIPVEVRPGDTVAAGSINGGGSLQIEATAPGTDNSLTTIVKLVEQAHARKGDRARLADRIARPLVPAVLIVAGLIALFGVLVGDTTTWTERALVVLVAASPCALAIAVPVTVISAIGSASRFGLIIKSGLAFERLGAIRRVAFDKTGTLTRNRPTVVDVATAPGFDRATVLRLAAALEAHSTHPLAAAIQLEVPAAPSATEVVEYPGQGISGTVDGAPVRAGSSRWVTAGALSAFGDEMQDAGMTVIVVEAPATPVGAIGIRDELKPEAAEAIARLQRMRIETVMLTGDNERTARALADKVGISEVRAAQKPEDKAEAIASYSRTKSTAMVGDGINDAPALASAHVGIAMGATGSAAALESADIAFTGTDLRLLPDAFAHARRGRAIMTANIGLALAVIIVLVPLSLFGVLGLASVVLVHELAEVVIIANGVRAGGRPGGASRATVRYAENFGRPLENNDSATVRR